MPSHKSAAKRMRQNPKRNERNRAARSSFRAALKALDKELSEGNREAAEKQLPGALILIGKTAKRGLIHRNKAARHSSRLVKRFNALGEKAS